jgi:glycosyltransferase involved in cell wall biosynthesis
MRKNLAIITTHPIQYQVPLFKEINKIKKFNSYVFYACDQGINRNKLDKDFNKKFSWNISMLSGYKFFFAKNNSNYNSWFLRFPNLSRELDKINCDSILILGWNKIIYLQAILYAIRKKIPLILRTENNLNSEKNIIIKIIKKMILPIFFSIFHKILYIGKLNKYFYLFYGVKKASLFYAPYFVDNDFFYGYKKKSHKFFNILFIGKFIHRKNPFDILKVAEMLKKYKNIKFILVGDGPLLLKCIEWAKEKSINNIRFEGFKNQLQIRKIYSRGHILVNSSSFETWGLVVNEAMSSGLPCIITSSTGCSSDLIRKGKTGYVYQVNDLFTLKKYILKIYNNKKMYFQMNSKVKIFIKNYNIKKTVSAISSSVN